jgi:glycosyltransferase involved in cell wall biosynthesis
MQISVIIHTLNSGKYIRQCLEAVRSFDEIIICDMYSTDDTLSIAKEYGATIVMHEPGGGIPEPARSFAVGQATKDWVLVVDSDEVIPEALKNYLYQMIASENCPDALFLPRKNYFMNRFMRAAFPDYQLRFFKKTAFKGWPAVIHSRPEIEGNVSKAPKKESLAIIHLEENRITDWISKHNRYTDRELDRKKNKRKSVASLLFQPTYRFILLYFIKGGIFDGKEGLIYAIIQACYKFFTCAKIIEWQKLQSNQSGSGK